MVPVWEQTEIKQIPTDGEWSGEVGQAPWQLDASLSITGDSADFV